MRNLFYILFSFYFFALAAAPCTDRAEHGVKKHSSLQSPDDEAQQDMDCTPLCTCSCCAALFLVKEAPSCTRQVAEINTIYTVHKASPETGAIIPIWQPPKLG